MSAGGCSWRPATPDILLRTRRALWRQPMIMTSESETASTERSAPVTSMSLAGADALGLYVRKLDGNVGALTALADQLRGAIAEMNEQLCTADRSESPKGRAT